MLLQANQQSTPQTSEDSAAQHSTTDEQQPSNETYQSDDSDIFIKTEEWGEHMNDFDATEMVSFTIAARDSEVMYC